MRLYKVTIDDFTLHFIAEDQDHVVTLLSQLVATTDYIQLIKRATIEQVAGPRGHDAINFYWGL